MNNKRFILSALTVGAAMLVGCPGPTANPDGGTDGGPTTPDSGHDTGPATPDTGPHDSGPADTNVSMPDANVPLTCAGLCAQIASACTGTAPATNANPYGDTTTCMTQCTATMWTVGTTADTSGNTLGCRVYHSIVAGMSATNAATHCPHTSLLGGGVCSPFRSDAPTEVTVTGTAHPAGYVRVDRMGMPAVATALIGTGVEIATGVGTHMTLQATNLADKNAYNDGNPDQDAAFTFGGRALGTLGVLHAALDTQLRTAHLTPCNMRFTPWPPSPLPAGAPYCAVQGLDGNPAHPVAGLILPDTLRLDPTSAGTFPNGRALADPVIDVTLAVLLLSTEHVCSPDRTCATLNMTACTAVASGCEWTGTACQNVDCESHNALTCAATVGCQANHCGAGTTMCAATSLLGVSQAPNDRVVPTASFPYFGNPWP